MVTVGILVVLFGSHVLGIGLHILGALALFVGRLLPGSALLAVYIAALGVAVLGRVAHIAHAIHAVFVFHDFHPLYVGKGSLRRQKGNYAGNFLQVSLFDKVRCCFFNLHFRIAAFDRRCALLSRRVAGIIARIKGACPLTAFIRRGLSDKTDSSF